MTEKVDPKTLKQPKDIVHQDRNWTTRVENQLNAQQKWANQWGYYAKGISRSIQVFPHKKSKFSKKNPLTTVLDLQKRRSINLMGQYLKQLHPHMEKEKTLSCLRTRNTTLQKTRISELLKDGYLKVGKNPNGLHVLIFLFSCRSL